MNRLTEIGRAAMRAALVASLDAHGWNLAHVARWTGDDEDAEFEVVDAPAVLPPREGW